jgi:hypothetical protein
LESFALLHVTTSEHPATAVHPEKLILCPRGAWIDKGDKGGREEQRDREGERERERGREESWREGERRERGREGERERGREERERRRKGERERRREGERERGERERGDEIDTLTEFIRVQIISTSTSKTLGICTIGTSSMLGTSWY